MNRLPGEKLTRWNDPRDPIWHGAPNEAKFTDVAISRFQAWSKDQDPEHIADHFCEHGQYIGYQGCFRNICPVCNGTLTSTFERAIIV